MSDPITILRKDHREAEELLRRLEASNSPGPRRRQTVEKLVAALTLHMEIEEQLVYPVAAEALGEDAVKGPENEHLLAREGLGKLEALQDEPGFGAAVDMVKAGIKHHVKEEEREMFPNLKRRLGRERLAKLGDEVLAMKQAKQPRARTRAA
jgi:hemerythrin-like domain-containing protein